MKKILIIEDDTVLRENTAAFIKEQNFKVFVAEDGLEGINQTLKHLPDLILCDISMPNMNGYEFYKTIKQINATCTIPLIFFSAKTEKEDIRAGMQLGADDYITKPFNFYELLKVIHIRLNKHNELQRVNNENMNALIKHPTLGVYIYQNGKIPVYNKSFANIFGYDYHDFSSIVFEQLIDEKQCNKAKILSDFNNYLDNSQGKISLTFKAKHKTLNSVSVELTGSVITYKGQISIAGNITKLDTKIPSQLISKDSTDLLPKLSTRELEVLALICKGKSTLETSKILFLGQRTIETYRSKLLDKTNSKNIAELMLFAIRNKLIVLE